MCIQSLGSRVHIYGCLVCVCKHPPPPPLEVSEDNRVSRRKQKKNDAEKRAEWLDVPVSRAAMDRSFMGHQT